MSGAFHTLGSIEAVRPVFLIVMGAFLAIIAWRLAKDSGIWTARFLVAGALLLGTGYAVVMPLYAAGLIRPYAPGMRGASADALAWHVVKLVLMNAGWLFFGLGLALHAKLFPAPCKSPRTQSPAIVPHESVA
jgi:dipeptide/tripeptide permease